MPKKFNGDEALAYGALSAGITLAVGYPGTPGTGMLNCLLEHARDHDLYVEWSTNERVALEMAIGASMAGQRALVCAKSVGMNVMLDPLMCLNMTGVHGGVVILLGDDPGAYGSQNDQDTRNLAPMIEIPVLEPASLVEGYAMVRAAFDLSERFNTAVIIRITRSYIQQVERLTLQLERVGKNSLGISQQPYRFVPYPGNAVDMHRHLHQRLADFEVWANRCQYNATWGNGSRGIVAAGFAYRKLLDVLGEDASGALRILKLSSLYPIPKGLIAQFFGVCDQILVLEEIDPYVETQLKALAFDLDFRGPIYGKQSGHVNWEGELFRWQIQAALEKYLQGFKPLNDYREADEDSEKPAKIDRCAKYPYADVLDLLLEVAQDLNQKPVIIADPGCMVKVADQLDAKFAIGSAVAVASGINKAGIDRKAVAFFGDSAFFHTALPAICNAANNRSDILIILLDNAGAASTGLQPTPASGMDALGNPAPELSIPNIARACGVEFVRRIDGNVSDAERRQAFRSGLSHTGLGMLIVEVKPAMMMNY